MNADTLEVLLAVITAAAAITLLFGYRSVRRTEAELTTAVDPVEQRLEGDPATLSTRAAAALARIADTWPGAVRILDHSDRTLTFEAHHLQNGASFGAGTLQFEPASTSASTDVQAVFVGKPGRQLTAAKALLIVGTLLVPAMWFVMHTWVVPHEEPAIAGQTLQMVQCVHILWPPFLLTHLARQQVRAVRTKLRALVNNLPFDQG